MSDHETMKYVTFRYDTVKVENGLDKDWKDNLAAILHVSQFEALYVGHSEAQALFISRGPAKIHN